MDDIRRDAITRTRGPCSQSNNQLLQLTASSLHTKEGQSTLPGKEDRGYTHSCEKGFVKRTSAAIDVYH